MIAGLGLLSSCQTIQFYQQAAAGQWEVLSKREPIEEVAKQTKDPALRDRLVLTQEILQFADEQLGLPSGGSYEVYSDIGRDHLVWVLYASAELSLSPKSWWYPVVGEQDYRGYFREDLARAEQAKLESEGYETWLTEVDAFSTLGVFRDPILNTFVERLEVDYVELIFHELCHRKYYRRGDTSFN